VSGQREFGEARLTDDLDNFAIFGHCRTPPPDFFGYTPSKLGYPSLYARLGGNGRGYPLFKYTRREGE
jgi:hypothetical protein